MSGHCSICGETGGCDCHRVGFYSPVECELRLSWREDGGLRIRSPTHPGMVLSHSDPDKVMLDVLPVLAEMGFPRPNASGSGASGDVTADGPPSTLPARTEGGGDGRD